MRRCFRAVGFAAPVFAALGFVPMPSRAEGPTFHKEVVRILQEKCQDCHRPGQVAPFSLLTFDQARKRATDIAQLTGDRRMPPWPASTEYGGPFRDQRTLTSAQIETLKSWVDAGCPEGDASDAPAPRTFASDWPLGEPDVILTIDPAFELGAAGNDEFRVFVLPTKFDGDRWIKAVDYRPGNRKVVHHILATIDASKRARELDAADPAPGYPSSGGSFGRGVNVSGFLPIWVPGMSPRSAPEGAGYFLPAGADVLLQLHYHKTGKIETDATSIGLYLSDKPLPRRVNHEFLFPQVTPAIAQRAAERMKAEGNKRGRPGLNEVMREIVKIPAGTAHFEIKTSTKGSLFNRPLGRDILVTSVMPHMHWLGKNFTIAAVLPDEKNTRVPIVKIDRWDFFWQGSYVFAEPLRLPAGTWFEMEGAFDNSAANPANPSKPPRDVEWGEQTNDEMFIGILEWVAAPDEKAAPKQAAAAEKAVETKAQDPARTAQKPAKIPAARIKAPPGFKTELLYPVPRETQGSWVNMTVDDKGRLIVSDQYGALYRVTPPAIGAKPDSIRVEKINAPIGEAHGLLWAFDSLYVVVNRGRKYDSGLYRVSDSNKDGDLDSVKLLRKLDGGGEHGPHAVILAPDGKSLYLVAGNATKLAPIEGSLVPRVWGEDNLLPRMVDGSGFMTDEKAPGGCIYKINPEGTNWELVSMGYRNPFDIAFNRDGELFTYDSDMEWDVNMPWYRPTRVLHVASGSDFGYRNGAGKWPPYYIDSLPPVVNVGPGSPTGIAFGYGASFPAKYQEALYLCDWSYGKLYALHLKEKGATYEGELEEFLAGTPLALTDVVVNPKDGAMYFAVGGRNTQSGLYRVTYEGPQSTATAHAPSDPAAAQARELRHKLEAFHGQANANAVETAWPHLGDSDRFIRWAARVAIEWQDIDTWREKAFAETSSPEASLNALLALAQVSAQDPAHRAANAPAPDPALRDNIIRALGRLNWDTLDYSQKLDVLRVVQVVLNRFGRPDDEFAGKIIDRLDPRFPARGRELNVELVQLLAFLQAPSAVEKTVALLREAPTQEEQIEYARALRVPKTGWTPELRKEYFSWFVKAANFRGGNSFRGFMANIKRDALRNLSEADKESLKSIIDAKPAAAANANAAPDRPFVKAWTLDELAPLVEAGLKDRDYDRGRAMFAAAKCFSCHRFNNEGGGSGPDLTGIAGRFSTRDLLESIVAPSKTISDQYEAVSIATTDGRVITGRIVNLNDDGLMINPDMLDPNQMINIKRGQIEEMKTSTVSLMPDGLLNSLGRDEALDLMAYLLSRGDRENAMFKRAAEGN